MKVLFLSPRFLALLPLAALAGCGPAGMPPPAAPPPPQVNVSLPVRREVTDHADFTGRTAAVESVEVRARALGYLDRVLFKEGSLVKKGDVLFEIDPRTYDAALKQAEGSLASMEARVNRLEQDLKRARQLIGRAMSQEEFDRIAGDKAEAGASLQGLKAAVERARLDLGFTKVIAPISGRVGRALVTEGNLVQSGEMGGGTLLTTIVSVDPMYVYFDVDERTVQHVRSLSRPGEGPSAAGPSIPVVMGLATQQGHPYQGVVDFIDNQVNPKTGTLRFRGVFPNKDGVLSPGFFTRVRIPTGPPRPALLVTDRALDNDQGTRIVYVVGRDGKVAARPVRLGAVHDGLRVIEEGLTPEDRVVVSGLLQIRPGLPVEAALVDMPTPPALSARGEGEGPSNKEPRNQGKEQQ